MPNDLGCWTHFFFFFNDTATTEIYTLSLHDALPISGARIATITTTGSSCCTGHAWHLLQILRDRKSTRLNSSHANISYAVFCLKKKYVHVETFTSAPPDNSSGILQAVTCGTMSSALI